MYLKSLEIQGFKSFADRTRIDFHAGVTAIVGPNGSGKSNVTDAIRWVLGEQSAKALRGGRMEDVIFNGTKDRRPLGYAEVTMLIDNSEGELPLDYREVAVTRRLYRSGESQYLINKQACRMRDIHELFMDTGLGKDAYSIISQGRVDEILSSNNDDRRRVFEEASGIQKFKSRRDEAARRLEQSEANLNRVQDILSEIQDQLSPLEKEAEKAKSYIKAYEEMKEKDLTLSVHQIARLDQRNREKQDILQKTEAERDACLREGLELEAESRSLREEENKLDAQLAQLRAEDEAKLQEMDALTRQKSAFRDSEVRLESEVQRYGDQVRQLNERAASLSEELTANEREEETRQADLQHAEEELQAKSTELEAVKARLSSSLRALEQAREERSSVQDAILVCRSELAERERNREYYADEKERLQTVKHERDEAVKAAEAELPKLLRDADEAGQNSQALEALRGRRQVELDALQGRLRAAEDAYNQCVRDLDQQQYRRDTLEGMERHYEGYSEAVRQLLGQIPLRSEVKRHIRGTVAENLRFDPRYEIALDIALGAAQQNVIVDDRETAAELIEILKRDRLGRVTFLPLSELKVSEPRPEIRRDLEAWRTRGYLGFAFDLIDCDPGFALVYRQLLGRVVVTEDLASASAIARAFRQSLRIVSLDGELISPGGAVSGGRYRRNSAALLARKREIQALTEGIQANEKKLDRAEAEIAKLERELQAATAALGECGRKLERSKEEQREMEARKNLAAAHLADLRKAAQAEDERLRLAEARGSEAQNDGTAVREKYAGLRADDEAKQQTIQRLEEAQEAILTERLTMVDRVSAAQTEVNRLQEISRSQKLLCERLRRDREQATRGRDEAQVQIQRAEEKRRRLESDKQRIEASLEAALRHSEEERRKREAGEAKRRSLGGKRDQLFERLRLQSERMSELEGSCHKLESQIEQAAADSDRLRGHIWDNYQKSYLEAEAYLDRSFDPAVYEDRIRELRQIIRRMGSVNVNAVESYQKQKERHDFLLKQQGDIQAARAELEELIRGLNERMRALFRENIARINSNFQEVFQDLFGGGQAEIRLQGDGDVLLADVDIRVSPPGKKLQNMLLLSGGERSLAAIALLFAILKLRPTPFCVLDEIEAALDEANVFRFSRFIRRYAARSQFILVTHRKGTMEAADTLYGVIMQERGVSRILSMQLGEAGTGAAEMDAESTRA